MNTLINLNYLDSFTKGDVEKQRKYIEMYLKSTPGVIWDFQTELDNQNLDNLRLKAHSIKPQAKYFGIESIEKILIEIESIVSNGGDVGKLQQLVTDAGEISDRVVIELNAVLNA